MNANAAEPPRLISSLLSDEPDMRDIVEEFVGGLATRVAEFRAAYERQGWDELRKLAHQLKGAGGSYGYPDLSTLAATMESAFRRRSAENFASWMQQLNGLVAAARAGLT